MRGRTTTAFEMGLREYVRTPVLVALLVFLPVYLVVVFTRIVPSDPVPVAVPGSGTTAVAMTDVTAALTTPLAGALVGGIAGLFLMGAARDVDGRLVLAGHRPREVALARFGLLALAAAVVTLVSVGVAATAHVPERPGWFLVATALVTLTYGTIGVLAGTVLDRLAGVYVMLFGPMVDLFLAQSPLAEDAPAVAPYLPGHHGTRLAFDAAFSTGVDLAHLGWGVAYLLGLAALALLAYYRTLGVE